MRSLPEPHGGKLVDLYVGAERAEKLKELSRGFLSWTLTPRQLCDLELLMNGAFSPVQGFLGRSDYESVLDQMRLRHGTLWPLPIVLDVTRGVADNLEPGAKLVLRDWEGVMLAALTVQDVWTPDLREEAEKVFGTSDAAHPGVAYLLRHTNPCYVGGTVEGVEAPRHHDFCGLRFTPAQLREQFERRGWEKVVAFQTRNPMHRAHQELTWRAASMLDANLLIHPVVGMTKPGDVDHYTRVRCYQSILKHYPKTRVMLSLLPLAMRMAGPREALWHAIIRQNFGCTHFIVGRDHAGAGRSGSGTAFYGAYDAQELLATHEAELGVEVVPFKAMVYVADRDEYMPEDAVPKGERVKTLSGTELRQRLVQGREIPRWFSFPETIRELRRTHPPWHRQGFTVLFTGLPSSGKSTLANVLMVKLLEIGGRPVTLLDGDLVRKHLSSELGFSKEHRDINIRRIGWVASEITKNHGIALCAPIAPYDTVRKEVRRMIEPRGGFILVYVATPLEVCEQRDRKGLYSKARAGMIKGFTGISDPYEPPKDAEVVIDTSSLSPEECVQDIVMHLEKEGYTRVAAESAAARQLGAYSARRRHVDRLACAPRTRGGTRF